MLHKIVNIKVKKKKNQPWKWTQKTCGKKIIMLNLRQGCKIEQLSYLKLKSVYIINNKILNHLIFTHNDTSERAKQRTIIRT